MDIVVVELTAGGVTGLGFSYVLAGGGTSAFSTARDLLEAHVNRQPLPPPPALWRRLANALNRLGRGPGYIGLAAIDVASWDLHAKLAGVPLGIAMGGTVREVQVYGSGFFSAGQNPSGAVAAAHNYADAGFTAVKPRASGTAADKKLLDTLACEIPTLQLMVDANEKCDLIAALALAAACRDVGALFLEEPLPSSNLDGYAALAHSANVAIAGGEHLQGCVETKPFLDRNALALLQPDLAMMGGLTECLRVTALAEQYGRPVSPHFLPDLFVHLAAVAPNIIWLEHFPLLEPLFQDAHGADRMLPAMSPPDRPGHGMAWADDVMRRVELLA